jgi:hypothetical protein
MLIFEVGISLFFFQMIRRGKDWARITYLIMIIFIFETSIPQIIKIIKLYHFFGILTILQFFLQFVAILLLFRRQAADWFKEIRDEKSLLQNPTNRPYTVNIAIAMLCFPVIFEIINGISTMILPVILDVVIAVFLFIMIWRRKKWARAILYGLVIFLIGKHIFKLPQLLNTDMIASLQMITLYVIQLFATFLLFTKPVENWLTQNNIDKPSAEPLPQNACKANLDQPITPSPGTEL